MNEARDERQEEKVRTHLVLNGPIYDWARRAMDAQGFGKFNEYISHLIRKDALQLELTDHQRNLRGEETGQEKRTNDKESPITEELNREFEKAFGKRG